MDGWRHHISSTAWYTTEAQLTLCAWLLELQVNVKSTHAVKKFRQAFHSHTWWFAVCVFQLSIGWETHAVSLHNVIKVYFCRNTTLISKFLITEWTTSSVTCPYRKFNDRKFKLREPQNNHSMCAHGRGGEHLDLFSFISLKLH